MDKAKTFIVMEEGTAVKTCGEKARMEDTVTKERSRNVLKLDFSRRLKGEFGLIVDFRILAGPGRSTSKQVVIMMKKRRRNCPCK